MRHRSRAVLTIAAVMIFAMVAPAPAGATAGMPASAAEMAPAAATQAAEGAVPVYRFYSTTFRGHFYTIDPTERDKVVTEMARDWTYEGARFFAYTSQVPGTVPLYRFWSASLRGHFYTAEKSERDFVVATWPSTWTEEGVAYYVYPAGSPVANTNAVYRFWGPGVAHHFYTASTAERDVVRSRWPSEWSYESERFRVPAGPAATPAAAPTSPQDGDGRFTIATYPDTQQEVWGTRFADRSTWLVSQRSVLDLRFVAHTGDVVNWDTDEHEQYVNAKAGMAPIAAAGIPYQLSIGNHDTMATGVGGGARDSKRTREFQRTTTTFNQFWKPSDYSALAGTFEAGKVDNTFSTFAAEGADWLVLNLELWPRATVVDWAESVIASHPDHNVVLQTHSFLDAAGNIDGAGQSQTRWSYGDSSPQYVYDRLVGPYANVKVAMSGHTGQAVSKVVTTAAGNNVAYLLQAIHSNTGNPVRLSQVDVSGGTISTNVYSPADGATWDVNVLTGLNFILP
ncbi:metallophosphoesterase [Microbacterium sp. P01]|uniref:metallophosphoesterase n=1 Tax=Microbacterium sp. P01 TaxID=3366261 RepID=UPI00366F48E2